MPDLASRRLAMTSWVLLPIGETMPIPVTTTRLMLASSACSPGDPPQASSRSAGSGTARLHHHRFLAEQADLEVLRAVDHRAVRGQPAVGNAEHQLRAHHALDVQSVHDLLHGRQDLAGKFQLAQAERAALAGRAEP